MQTGTTAGSILASARVFLAIAMLSPATGLAQRDTIVRNAGAPMHASGRLVEDLSIGVVDGADELMFADVYDVLPGSDGTLYVFDRSVQSIRVYDPNGRFVRSFGRRGQGPGEIGAASGTTILRDGRLLLFDSGNRRINVYSLRGDVITHWPVPVPGTFAERVIFADTAGYVYVRKTTIGRISPQTRAAEAVSQWLVLRASDGVLVDSIPEPVWPAYPEPFVAFSANGRVQLGMPFTPRRLSTMSPSGAMITGLPDRYAFEINSRRGAPISVRRNVPAERVTDAERSDTRRRMETRLRAHDPSWSWGGRDIPRTKPLYVDIAIGLDGRIWIVRQAPTTPPRIRSAARTGGGASTTLADPGEPMPELPGKYDVFEADGRFIGSLEAPQRVKILATRGDYAWGVARNEDDVQFVRRYRIVWN